jgi:hypothetical protein
MAKTPERRWIVTRPSCVPLLLAIQIGAISLMLSCASSQPVQRLTVRVPSGFVGAIHLDTCVPSASASDLSTNSVGAGATSACPARDGNIEITVVRGDRKYTVAPSDVSISRTGDGIPTGIRAEVRP